jgi:hypothetical protein
MEFRTGNSSLDLEYPCHSPVEDDAKTLFIKMVITNKIETGINIIYLELVVPIVRSKTELATVSRCTKLSSNN